MEQQFYGEALLNDLVDTFQRFNQADIVVFAKDKDGNFLGSRSLLAWKGFWLRDSFRNILEELQNGEYSSLHFTSFKYDENPSYDVDNYLETATV